MDAGSDRFLEDVLLVLVLTLFGRLDLLVLLRGVTIIPDVRVNDGFGRVEDPSESDETAAGLGFSCELGIDGASLEKMLMNQIVIWLLMIAKVVLVEEERLAL